MALSYKNDEQQDERLDPYSDTARQLHEKEQSGYDREFDDIAKNYGDTADSSQEDDNIAKTKNISAAKDQEENGGGEGWRNNFTGNQQQKATGKANFLKKKGPLGAIVALVLGGGGIFGLLFTPGLGIVQLKEVLTQDLNDQVTAMDIRTDHVLQAKMKGMTKTFSFCSSVVNVRCKFSTMSGRQVKNFEKAGITVECDGDCKTSLLSRNKIKSIQFEGEEKMTDPGKVVRFARSNVAAASAMRRAYNPTFAGFTDKVATTVFQRLGLSKKPVVDGKDKKASDEKLEETVRNGSTDPEGGTIPSEEDGTQLTDEEKAKASGVQQELIKEAEGVRSSGVKATSGAIKGGAKGVGIIGVLDTACSLYRADLAVETGAKLVRATQLARYAMAFLSVADAIKAGTATPDEVSYVGNILTKTDTQKTVSDPNDPNKQITNPMYGKSAFDSAGYAVAAYNDAPTLSYQDAQYTIGGTGPLATLIATNALITKKLGSSPSSTCRVIQNPFTRIGSLAIGVAVGAVSLGSETAISVGASSAIGFAVGIAQSMLVDILAGTSVDSNTYGAEAGDAIFSGTASLLGNIAQSRGLSPLTPSTIQQYQAATDSTKNEDVAIAKYDAKGDQFNVMDQYSFMGSLARSFLPTLDSGTGSLAKLADIVSLPLQLVGNASATSSFNPDRYKQCNDTTYAQMGLSTDVFCNLRYGLTNTELNMDTDTVVDYMISNHQIDETTGDAISGSDYEKYLQSCINRTDPYTNDGDKWETGKVCYDQDPEYQNFRVYTVDSSISDGMDGVGETGASSGSSSGSDTTSTTTSGNIAWPVDEKWWKSNRTDFLNAHTMISGTFTSPYVKGEADDISSPPVGTPVMSMFDGKVIKTNLCPASQPNGVMIESKVDGGTLDVAYGHGINLKVKEGDQVTAGQEIMTLNGIGCKVFGPHLHIDMSYNGKHVCPQDVFLAMGNNETPDWAALTAKANPGCGRT